MFIQYLDDRYIQFFIFYCSLEIEYELDYQYHIIEKRKKMFFMRSNYRYRKENEVMDDEKDKVNFNLKLANIKNLCLAFEFNIPIRNIILPKTIKSLTFGNSYNRSICNLNHDQSYLPQNLKKLIFGFKFNRSIENLTFKISYLPQNLKILDLGYNFNKSIDYLPQSLKELNLSCKFKQTINNLSFGLRKLYLSKKYNLPIDHLKKEQLEIIFI